jgi:hypothetical protein
MKRFLLGLLLCAAIAVQAQSQSAQDLKSVYSLTRDTVTNTATIYLSSTRVAATAGSKVTVYVAVTKISGTVGGTLTLQGSMDGTTFKALNTQETQTALATITATDATNTYHWRLDGNPFPFYRVSWTGTGTMSASFTSRLQAR